MITALVAASLIATIGMCPYTNAASAAVSSTTPSNVMHQVGAAWFVSADAGPTVKSSTRSGDSDVPPNRMRSPRVAVAVSSAGSP